MPMSLLSMDIHELPVRLHLVSEEPIGATLFLHSHGPRGQEGMLERLNGAESFLPFRWDDRIHLVARSSIVYLQSQDPSPENPDLPDQLADPLRLGLRLRNGAALSGEVHVFLPTHRNRLSDFLNLKECFFALSGKDGVVVVNKDWIESVEPLKDEI
jgi:hypothetical protein